MRLPGIFCVLLTWLLLSACAPAITTSAGPIAEATPSTTAAAADLSTSEVLAIAAAAMVRATNIGTAFDRIVIGTRLGEPGPNAFISFQSPDLGRLNVSEQDAVTRALAPALIEWVDDVVRAQSDHIAKLPDGQTDAVLSLSRPKVVGSHAEVVLAIFFGYYNSVGRAFQLDRDAQGDWLVTSVKEFVQAF